MSIRPTVSEQAPWTLTFSDGSTSLPFPTQSSAELAADAYLDMQTRTVFALAGLVTQGLSSGVRL